MQNYSEQNSDDARIDADDAIPKTKMPLPASETPRAVRTVWLRLLCILPGFCAETWQSGRFFHFGAVSSFFWATFVASNSDFKDDYSFKFRGTIRETGSF